MLIPIADVLALIPVARSTLYLRMVEPDFPKPIKIGGKVFWEMQEILAYIESKKAEA